MPVETMKPSKGSGREFAAPAALPALREVHSVGPFVLGRTLGEGTTGKVRVAFHRETGFKVAVKIVRKDALAGAGAAAVRQKVQREIAVLKLLDHPHVLRLYDVYETPRSLFVVMELVAGGELFDYIVRRAHVPAHETRRLFREILAGVAYLHSQGIAHRDLKPENILLDAAGHVKIADLGMAAVMREGALLATSCGSPHYASPEVVCGTPYDGRAADIWSCGVILYTLTTSNLPFDDDSLPRLLDKVCRGAYSLPAFVPPDTRDLIARMLTVDPARRITMPEIRCHPWFTAADAAAVAPEAPLPEPALDCDSPCIAAPALIDPDVLATLEALRLGRRADIEHELLTAPHSQARAYYNILLRQKHASGTNGTAASGAQVSPPSPTVAAAAAAALVYRNRAQSVTDPPFPIIQQPPPPQPQQQQPQQQQHTPREGEPLLLGQQHTPPTLLQTSGVAASPPLVPRLATAGIIGGSGHTSPLTSTCRARSNSNDFFISPRFQQLSPGLATQRGIISPLLPRRTSAAVAPSVPNAAGATNGNSTGGSQQVRLSPLCEDYCTTPPPRYLAGLGPAMAPGLGTATPPGTATTTPRHTYCSEPGSGASSPPMFELTQDRAAAHAAAAAAVAVAAAAAAAKPRRCSLSASARVPVLPLQLQRPAAAGADDGSGNVPQRTFWASLFHHTPSPASSPHSASSRSGSTSPTPPRSSDYNGSFSTSLPSLPEEFSQGSGSSNSSTASGTSSHSSSGNFTDIPEMRFTAEIPESIIQLQLEAFFTRYHIRFALRSPGYHCESVARDGIHACNILVLVLDAAVDPCCPKVSVQAFLASGCPAQYLDFCSTMRAYFQL